MKYLLFYVQSFSSLIPLLRKREIQHEVISVVLPFIAHRRYRFSDQIQSHAAIVQPFEFPVFRNNGSRVKGDAVVGKGNTEPAAVRFAGEV